MNTSQNTIELGDIYLDVTYKKIKNVHLSVHPPQGRVTVSAPIKMDLETIRLFIISKLGWIRRQQVKLRGQKREVALEYINRESHYYLGQRYLLKIVEENSNPRVILKHSTIELHVRVGATKKQKEELLQTWYRLQLKEVSLRQLAKIQKKINVKIAEVSIRTMKTKWGTCNIEAKRIWLNTELAKKSVESIEYVLVHEMTHLLERNHNEKYIAHMNKFLPKWKHMREELNRTALGHVEWEC